MYPIKGIAGTRSFRAAALACIVTAAGAVAMAREVTVAIPVNTQGLDLDSKAGALTLYTRLQDAAWVACTRANRIGLEPVEDVLACTEKALQVAIKSAHKTLLTQIYLERHTPAQAAAAGIGTPTIVAAK